VADIVGQDDKVARHVERLAWTVQLVRELRRQELLARPAGAVEHHDGIGHLAPRIPLRCAERRVVEAQFGQALAGGEAEVLERQIRFFCRPSRCRRRRRRGKR
jgi:hypothetical protein